MRKRVAVIFLFFECICICNSGGDGNVSYLANDLDCSYRPSCKLNRSSNASATIPFVAGCKCDVDCSEYNDCCKDSKYFGRSRLRSNREFHCHPKLEVRMVASCPESYRNTSVARNCSFALPAEDVSFVVPVTNEKTRTTYANMYCAGCHNESDYEPWDLTVDFVEITPSFFENEYWGESGAPVDRSFDLEDDVSRAAAADARNSRSETAAAAAAERIHAEELFGGVRFRPAYESFVAEWRGRQFACAFDSRMPAEMAAFVRPCLPNLISECPEDGRENRLCQSYTEIVYETSGPLAFRNKDCAECNSVPPQAVAHCPRPTEAPAADRARGGFVISGRNKAANRDLCANPILPGYFCPTRSE